MTYYAPVSYWYPDLGVVDSRWQSVLDTQPPFALVNPNSGPGTSTDPAYVDLCGLLDAAGIRTVGYVSTTWGERSEATILSEIESYRDWYGVKGVFFDECPNFWASNQQGHVSKYASLRDQLRTLYGDDFLIIHNPGTVPIEAMIPLADLHMSFESSATNYLTNPDYFPEWLQAYAAKMWHVVYGVTEGNAQAVMDKAGQWASHIYLTDRGHDPAEVDENNAPSTPENNPYLAPPAPWLLTLQQGQGGGTARLIPGPILGYLGSKVDVDHRWVDGKASVNRATLAHFEVPEDKTLLLTVVGTHGGNPWQTPSLQAGGVTSFPNFDTGNVVAGVEWTHGSVHTGPAMVTLTVGNTSPWEDEANLTRFAGTVVSMMVSSDSITETVEITLGADLEARDQLRAALSVRGLDYRTVDEIPFDIELVGTGSARDLFRGCAALTSVPLMDTSGVTNMRSMFNACSSLTSVPDMDTSGVTNMGWMFQDCSSLTTVPWMDTSNVTDMNSMFRACVSLTSVPDLDTSNVTNVSYMFYDCAALTDGNVRLIGRRPSVGTGNMTTGSGLTREPWYNADGTPDDSTPIEVVQITLSAGFSARDQFRAALTARGLDYATVTELPFNIELVGSGEAIHMFYGCHALTSVPPLDTSQVTNMNGMFQECGSLVAVPPLDTSNVVRAPSMFAYCRSLTSVPDMDAAKIVDVAYMFTGCTALTDGNVRLIGRNPNVTTASMISSSGLTRQPWYNADGTPLGPRKVTIEKNSAVAGFVQPATGDVSLIDRWTGTTGEIGAFFVAPVICNYDLRNATNYSTIRAGDTIPAGQGVYPTYAQVTPYVFTEVW